MAEDTTAQQATFVRGNDHLDRLLSDPLIASDIAWANPILAPMTEDASMASRHEDAAQDYAIALKRPARQEPAS